MRRMRLVAGLLALAVFLVGGVAGAVAMRLAYDAALLAGARKDPEQRHADQVLWGLQQKLHLERDQRQRIADRFHARWPEMVTFLRDVEPSAASLRRKYQEDIREELTPAQRQTFERVVEEDEERHRKALSPPTPP
jgi:uncharacterized membrane protein